MTELSLELAGSVYRVAGMIPEQAELLQARFGALLCRPARSPDVRIDVHFTPSPEGFMRRPVGPVEYRVAVVHGERALAVAGIGFTGDIDRAPLAARMHTCLFDRGFVTGFENLFRVVASHRIFLGGGLVLHSAGLVDGGRAFVFCGRSGAGKTTLCELATALGIDVLSDELNAVIPGERGLDLIAMPFAGDFGAAPRRHLPYPLVGWLGLEQAESPRVSACSKAEAVSRIVAACPYVNVDPHLADQVADRAVELVSRLPLRILRFAKRPTFWSVLENEYRNVSDSVSP